MKTKRETLEENQLKNGQKKTKPLMTAFDFSTSRASGFGDFGRTTTVLETVDHTMSKKFKATHF